MTNLVIESNSTTYVRMYENPSKWIKLGPWIQLCNTLPTYIAEINVVYILLPLRGMESYGEMLSLLSSV